MKDELHELLRLADASASAPPIDVRDLPNRVRHTARCQRRISAGGLFILALLAVSPLLFLYRRPIAPPIASGDQSFLEVDAELHSRTAILLEAAEQEARSNSNPTDAFLVALQLQRDRAALVLLRDADHKLHDHESLAATTLLRRAIKLFPETHAAALAEQKLNQLDFSKRQS